MPGYDGTGPRGQGSMSGGGRGYCAVPVSESPAVMMGRGRGFGRGMGRGFRNCFYATGFSGWNRGQVVGQENELSVLKNQASYLKQQLDFIQGRVSQLEQDGSSETR
jgi:hypothetical protein